MHSVDYNHCLILYVIDFVNEMIESYEEWKLDMAKNPFYERNMKESFTFHNSGLGLFINGIPIIA